MQSLLNWQVEVIGIGTGMVINVRFDSNGRPIYTIHMDNPNATPDGLFVARTEELRRIS